MEISNYYRHLEEFRKEAIYTFNLEKDKSFRIDFPELRNHKEMLTSERKVIDFFKQTKFDISQMNTSILKNDIFLLSLEDTSKETLIYSSNTIKKIRQSSNSNEHIHNAIDYFILLSKELENFIKFIEPHYTKPQQPKQIESKNRTKQLKWYGSQSELIELTKALIENGNLKGKQEDIFKEIQENFNFKLNNIDQAITKFNTRTEETETKFLNSLKKSLSEYISNKLNKNR